MNLIRQLRIQAKVTQQELAARVGTSQPAIAAYESGSKSPTLRTVQRFAAALNLELVATFAAPMTREEARSLAYHEAIAEALAREPGPILSRARRSLRKLRKLHPHAIRLFERWAHWLQLPLEELMRRIADPAPDAREMRHVSPFSGVLKASERTRILKEIRREQQ